MRTSHVKWRKSSDKFQQTAKQRRDLIKAQLDALKRLQGCLECGRNEPVGLDWHHRNHHTKVLNISDMLSRGFSWAKVQEEVSKRKLLCAYCHRLATNGLLLASKGRMLHDVQPTGKILKMIKLPRA